MASERLFVPHTRLTTNGTDRGDYSGFRGIHQQAGAGDAFRVSVVSHAMLSCRDIQSSMGALH